MRQFKWDILNMNSCDGLLAKKQIIINTPIEIYKKSCKNY